MRESANAPIIPPAAVAAASIAGQRTAHATAPMKHAPATAAADPRAVTPPDVPAGTILNVAIDRGGASDSVPISVLHVSAHAVAIAPPPIAVQSHVHAGSVSIVPYLSPHRALIAAAAMANNAPFASTCSASRAPSFSSTPAVRCARSASR